MPTNPDQEQLEQAPNWRCDDTVLRVLHMVRVDDIEYIFYDIENALQKLAEEPCATLEPITVH
jgi:hypothetical protein